MTPENFVYWLKGILEDNDTNKLEPKKFKKIKEKLAEVTGDSRPVIKPTPLVDIRPDVSWSPYWSSWSSHPMKRYDTPPKELKSDSPMSNNGENL